MFPPEPEVPEAAKVPIVLLAGASGYVGGRLLTLLERQPVALRCLARNPDKLRPPVKDSTRVVRGDVLDPSSLDEALRGVHTAYYLVHLMSGSQDFEKDDRRAATNFAQTAAKAGVRRIIYLGGLGDDADPKLSPHLRSRHEVGRILKGSGVETIEFRASLVIGTGSLSFDLVKSLTDRLPVMLCPRWLTTPTQPIAVDDVLAYLLAARDLPPRPSRVFEIGSPDVTTYGGMIREYARQKGLRRWLISVPVLTPYLSSLWLALVTPAAFEVGRHLIEGLKNPTVVRDKAALEVFPVRPMGIREAIQKALTSSSARTSRRGRVWWAGAGGRETGYLNTAGAVRQDAAGSRCCERTSPCAYGPSPSKSRTGPRRPRFRTSCGWGSRPCCGSRPRSRTGEPPRPKGPITRPDD